MSVTNLCNMKFLLPILAIVLALAWTVNVYAEDSPGLAITVVVPSHEEQQPTPSPTPAPTPAQVFPTSVFENREGNRREIIRVYELREHESAMQIPRESFEREGFRFELAEITRRDMPSFTSRAHVETVTVNTQTNDMSAVLQMLPPTIEFATEDGYFGVLALDISTIQMEQDGTRTSNRTVTTTREFPHLSSPDTSLIPRSVTERGRTYQLSDVQWRQQDGTAVDYRQLPVSFTAVATFSATATSSVPTGFTTTAEFVGVISRVTTGFTEYTAYFLGIPIVTPIISPPITSVLAPVGSDENNASDNGYAENGIVLPPVYPNMYDYYDIADVENGTYYSESCELETLERQERGATAIIVVLLLIIIGLLAYIFKSHLARLIGVIKSKFNKTSALALALLMAMSLVMAQPITMYAVPPYRFGGGQQAVHFNETGVVGNSREHLAVGEFSSTTPSIYQYGDFLGTLHVERLNRTVRVYAGATMEAMDFGAGHFSFTGLNRGNTGLVGHNRGRTNGFFSFVRHLREGDIITLDANGVMRSYALTMLYTIDETDFSPLMEFNDNRLTLITCVEYVSHKRRVAVLLEIV